MNNPIPVPLIDYMIDHRLEQQPDAKDFTINVETEVILARQVCDPKKSSFSFSPHEFVKEDKSLNKEKLYYFLIEAGIEESSDVEFMINDMILSVSNLPCLKDNGFRGVLTVFLYVRFTPIEPIQSDE